MNFALLLHFDPYLLPLIKFEPIWTIFCGLRVIEESNMLAFRNKLRISHTIGPRGKRLGHYPSLTALVLTALKLRTVALCSGTETKAGRMLQQKINHPQQGFLSRRDLN